MCRTGRETIEFVPADKGATPVDLTVDLAALRVTAEHVSLVVYNLATSTVDTLRSHRSGKLVFHSPRDGGETTMKVETTKVVKEHVIGQEFPRVVVEMTVLS